MLAQPAQPGSLFRFSAGTYVPVGLAEPRLSSDDRARSVCLHLNSNNDGDVADGAHVCVYMYVYLGDSKQGEVWRPGC